MLGLILWCILLIIIAVCITPWWFFPVIILVTLATFIMKKNKSLQPSQATDSNEVKL